MIRFLFSTASLVLIVPVFLDWAKAESEQQIDKMQEAAFNTPGVEAPLPGRVLAGAAILLVGHLVAGRLILRLSPVAAFLSLLLGGTAGVGAFFLRRAGG